MTHFEETVRIATADKSKSVTTDKNFRLFDDDFMTKCFEDNKEATELVLRIVLLSQRMMYLVRISLFIRWIA